MKDMKFKKICEMINKKRNPGKAPVDDKVVHKSKDEVDKIRKALLGTKIENNPHKY